jgi:ferredoxin
MGIIKDPQKCINCGLCDDIEDEQEAKLMCPTQAITIKKEEKYDSITSPSNNKE